MKFATQKSFATRCEMIEVIITGNNRVYTNRQNCYTARKYVNFFSFLCKIKNE